MMCFARKAACAVMALAMTMTMASCSTPGSSATSASPDDTAKTAVTVVSSIAQWGSLASAIAGDDVKVTILDSGVLHIDTLSGVLKQWYAPLKQWYAPGAWTWYAEEDFDGVDIDDVWARSGGAKDRFRRDS